MLCLVLFSFTCEVYDWNCSHLLLHNLSCHQDTCSKMLSRLSHNFAWIYWRNGVFFKCVIFCTDIYSPHTHLLTSKHFQTHHVQTSIFTHTWICYISFEKPNKTKHTLTCLQTLLHIHTQSYLSIYTPAYPCTLLHIHRSLHTPTPYLLYIHTCTYICWYS